MASILNKGDNIYVKNLILPLMLYGYLLKQIYSYFGVGYNRLYDGAYAYDQLPASNLVTVAIVLAVLVGTVCLSFGTMSRYRVAPSILLCTVALTIGVVTWTIITVSEVGVLNLLYTSTPPYVYLTALALFIGMDKDLFLSFIKHAPIIGAASLVLGMVDYIQFLVAHPDSILGNSSSMVYYVQGIILMSIYSFCSEKPNKFVVYSAIAVCAVYAVFLNSRSWIIQSAIWLVAYVWYWGKRGTFVKFLKIAALVSIAAVAVYFIMDSAFPHIIERLESKMEMDTRSAQYADLFNQTEWYQFVIGEGFTFTYDSSLQSGEYGYIDNAYLLMLIRYGLIIGVTYTLMFLIPVLHSRFSKESVPLIMWLLALGGLSVYCVTTIDIKSIAIAICAGHCLATAKEKREGPELVTV